MIDIVCNAAAGLSAAALLISAVVQLLRADRHELSLRTATALLMIVLAVVLAGAAWRGDAGLIASAGGLLSSGSAAWLVWVPHQHPVLQRATTGFGLLDPDTGAPS